MAHFNYFGAPLLHQGISYSDFVGISLRVKHEMAMLMESWWRKTAAVKTLDVY